jgi:LysR family hydrogen peroxide-inducible transcriptional activator
MQEGHCLADQALEFCHTKGDFSPSVSCRSAQVQTLLALVETGLGLSIVPEMAAVPKKGVVYREIGPMPPRRKIGFVWRSNRFQPLAAVRFVERARAMFGR